MSKPKRPRDVNQLAKFIVDTATGNAPPVPAEREKNPAAVALGKLGGAKGGAAGSNPAPSVFYLTPMAGKAIIQPVEDDHPAFQPDKNATVPGGVFLLVPRLKPQLFLPCRASF